MAMTWEKIEEGFVTRREPGTPTAVAAGSRCALTNDGELVCTYMVQSKLGVNDFVPTLSRSADFGKSWTEQGPIWPRAKAQTSGFVSVSRSPSGELFLYGIETPIETPGETFWNETTQGMKQNYLVWSRSADGGRVWSNPEPIPLPIAGSAEAPGPMTALSSGRWVSCYAPYNNYDPSVEVDRGQIVLMRSDDRGRAWSHTSMLRFAEPHSGGAEAWVVELADGRLLGTSWHTNLRDGSDYPCAYSLSADGGETWSPTRSTGIAGQTTALTALPDGSALFLNCRRKGDVGIAMARVRPTENEFVVLGDEFVWRAERVRQSEGEADHSSWQEFAFGEPSAVLLPGGEVFVTFWTVQPAKQGIAYVRLKLIGEF
jgi:hypothetical protein